MLRYSQHSERAVLSLLASKEVVFLQVSVSRGILSVLLADVVSSQRCGKQWDAIKKPRERKAYPNFVCGPHRDGWNLIVVSEFSL